MNCGFVGFWLAKTYDISWTASLPELISETINPCTLEGDI